MSGVARVAVELGEVVAAKQPLAVIADAIGSRERVVRAAIPAVVIGRSELPVVHRGDALVHLGHL
jgi:predicted deacylase